MATETTPQVIVENPRPNPELGVIAQLLVERQFEREKIEQKLSPEQLEVFKKQFEKYTLSPSSPNYVRAILERNTRELPDRVVVFQYWDTFQTFASINRFHEWLMRRAPPCLASLNAGDVLSALLIEFGNNHPENILEEHKAFPLSLSMDPFYVAYCYNTKFQIVNDGIEPLAVMTDFNPNSERQAPR